MAPHSANEPAAIAVPLLVAGRVVAVLYAAEERNGREQVVPSAWPEVVEVLARHAARCLEMMTVRRLPELVGAVRPPSSGDVGPRAT